MSSDKENLLIKVKDVADSTLDSLGIIPPDRLMNMVKKHEEAIKKLDKKIYQLQSQINDLKKSKRTKRNQPEEDLGGFDRL